MIWRFLLAVVLLGVVVGGIVGFNMFRDKAIEGFFASMQPPPVTVSVIEAEPSTWTPGHRGDRHRQRGARRRARRRGRRHRPGDPLPGQRPGRGRRSCWSRSTTAIERADLAAAQASARPQPGDAPARRGAARARRRADLRPRRRPRRCAPTPRPGLKLTAVMEQKALRAPFAGIIGIPQVEVGALRHRRHRLCDAAGPRHHAGRLLGARAADPAGRDRHAGDRLRPRSAAPPLPGKIIAIEPRIDPNSPPRHPAGRARRRGGQHQPRPVPARARRAARGGRA